MASPASRVVDDACKRTFDVVAAAGGLLALAPLLALLVGAECAVHGWPPFFRQRRPGLRGRIFSLWKLRSMTSERGPDGELLPDSQRLTEFGKWLRATSLDELPELYNVLRGDMSLVGPRPLLVQYLELYSPEQMRRHEVRPGITGWAQINGRNGLSWEEKFALDVWYVDNRSFRLDLLILFRTLRAVVAREGITAEGEATMPNFLGSKNAEPAV